MKKSKIIVLAIAVVFSATGIYGKTKKGRQTFNADATQAVSGTSDVLTSEDYSNANCQIGSNGIFICTIVTRIDAPDYSIGQAIPREHIQSIIHSYNQ